MTTYSEGIDISKYQGDINWFDLRDKGNINFIIAKATEGGDYQDPKFLEYWKKMDDFEFYQGAYHFLRFGTSSAKEQMDNLLTMMRRAGGWGNKCIIALDVEKVENTDLISSTTEECVMYLEDNVIFNPYIYTTQAYWNKYVPKTPEKLQECPLWIARWREAEPSKQDLPNGWNSWDIWQYSSTGSVPGISGHVDLDRMHSS